MRLRARACPLCGSDDSSRVVVESNYRGQEIGEFGFSSRKTPEFLHLRMVRCPTCDLVYVPMAPDPDWIQTQYRDAAYDASEESQHAAETYTRYLGPLLSDLPDRNGALDIGAGDGAFIERLVRSGFTQVVGVEPSLAPLEQARPEVRTLIREGVFGGNEAEAGSLSLVTCFQTLEHTEAPAALSSGVRRLLKPGGAFYVVTHDHRSLSARVLGARSPIFDIEHLQLYSRRSLRFMLERAGFEQISIRPIRNEYPLAYWLKLLPIPLKLKESMRAVLARTRIDRWPLSIPAGNLMAVGHKPGVPPARAAPAALHGAS